MERCRWLGHRVSRPCWVARFRRRVSAVEDAVEQVIAVPEFGTDLPQLIGAIESRGWAYTSHGDLLQIEAPAASSADVGRAATEAGVTLRQLTPQQDNLEDIFLRLTGGTDAELAASRGEQRTTGATR